MQERNSLAPASARNNIGEERGLSRGPAFHRWHFPCRTMSHQTRTPLHEEARDGKMMESVREKRYLAQVRAASKAPRLVWIDSQSQL